MPRFPVKQESIKNQTARITGSDYKHITKVLRLRPGDEITLFNEDGIEYTGRIEEIGTKDLKVTILSSRCVKTESNLNITLIQGIPKGDKMDLIVEKATELGVKTIIPTITERTQIRNTEKLKRWQKIAIESSKQCRRTTPPTILEPKGFNEAINISNQSELKLIFHEKNDNYLTNIIKNLIQLPVNITICIGSEGGFSETEVATAREKGFTPVGLGPRILRTETASIVAVSILQFVFGDIGTRG
jgi:16S rRNA (uracil1498-N3)-methyltransferase